MTKVAAPYIILLHAGVPRLFTLEEGRHTCAENNGETYVSVERHLGTFLKGWAIHNGTIMGLIILQVVA
jgi:hypothetical protein